MLNFNICFKIQFEVKNAKKIFLDGVSKGTVHHSGKSQNLPMKEARAQFEPGTFPLKKK